MSASHTTCVDIHDGLGWLAYGTREGQAYCVFAAFFNPLLCRLAKKFYCDVIPYA